MLDRQSQTKRIVRKAFTRPIPLIVGIIGAIMLAKGAVLWGGMLVLIYLVISVGLMFSPKFVKRVVDESWNR